MHVQQVGVFANVRGDFSVVEYSDIAPEMARLTNRDGQLTFSSSHLCINYYTLEFLQVRLHVSYQRWHKRGARIHI